MSLFVDLRIAEQNTAAFCLQRADCATTTLMDYDLRNVQAKQERICNFFGLDRATGADGEPANGDARWSGNFQFHRIPIDVLLRQKWAVSKREKMMPYCESYLAVDDGPADAVYP